MQKRLPEGYTLRGEPKEALLYKSTQNTLLKAHNEKYGNCILKMNTREIVQPAEVRSLEKEFNIQFLLASRVAKEQILEIYEKLEHNGFHILVTEDFGATSLHTHIEKNGALNLASFLNIGTKIAQCMTQIHSCRVIHFDLKPSNILYSQELDTVKVIDFATAALTTIQRPSIPDSKIEGGTTAYMSPEQTRRMNTNVDRRSDIYSLGLTYYTLLTGRLPFDHNDAEEVLAAHLSKQPRSINEVRAELALEPVPEAVLSVINKMIEKDVNQRYQSVQTVWEDLKTLSAAFEADGSLPADFTPAQNDIMDEFSIASDRLYGRSKEIASLTSVIEQSLKGRKQLCTVKGYSGIGKSALVDEVVKQFKDRVVLTSGKYDQINKSIPYSAFSQAIHKLVNQMLGFSTSQLKEVRVRLMEALNGNGNLLVDIVPEIQALLPDIDVSTKSTLSGQELQNTFQETICTFFRVVSSVFVEDAGFTASLLVVLFLDDLQWADYNSLLLIEKMVSTTNLKVLIIGAYRDNEVDETHPLSESLATMKKNDVTITDFKLLELAEEDLNELIADTTHHTIDDTRPLTRQIFAKTQGNPFFSREFLSNLYTKDILTFNHETRTWDWDLDAIARSSFADNVVDFMLSNISEAATDESKRVLSYAACIGAEFSVANLSELCELSANETMSALTQSIQEGWVFEVAQNRYKFAHDRVQEATYELLTTEEKSETHRKLGLSIHTRAQLENTIEEHVFEIVNHLNKAADLIRNSDSERVLAIQLNNQAAEKAISASANSLAVTYCENNLLLFREDSWETEYELRFAAGYLFVRSLTNNKQSAEASEVGVDILTHVAGNELHALKIQSLLIILHTGQAQYENAYELLIKVLTQHASRYGEFELEDAEKMNALIGKNFGETTALMNEALKDVNNVKLLNDEHLDLFLQCMSCGAACFFLVAKANFAVYLQVASFTTKLILEQGICTAMPILFGAFSLSVFIFTQDMQFANRIVHAARKWTMMYWPTDWMLCDASYHFAFWAGADNRTIADSTKDFLTTYRTGLSTGNNVWGSFGGAIGSMQMVFSGHSASDALDFVSRNFTFSAKCSNILSMLLLEDFKNTLLMMKGDRDEFTDKEEYVLKPSMGIDPHSITYFRSTSPLMKAWVYIHYDRFVEAYPLVQKALEFIADCTPFIQLFIVPFICAYICTEILFRGLQDEVGKSFDELLAEIDGHIASLEKYSAVMPRYLTCALYLIQGDRERLKGPEADSMKVIKHYQDAVTRAKSDHLPTIQALGYLRLSQYLQRKGFFPESYVSSINAAIDIYKTIGYNFMVNKLQEQHADLLNSVSFASTSVNGGETRMRSVTEMNQSNLTTTMSDGPSTSSNQILRAASSFQDADSSKDVNFKVLFSNMLPVILSNTSATRAVLILKEDDELRIEASISASIAQPEIFTNIVVTEEHVATSIVNRTTRTRSDTLVANVAADQTFSSDAFFKSHPQVKCAMATPILYQNKVRGAIYLENSEMTAVFTPERARLLATIISVSIHNAQFFTQLTNSYARFLPKAFLELLGRKNVLDVQQGDNVTHYCCVSFLDIRNFTGITEKLTSEGSMRFVNQFLEYLCPEIENNDGFIDKFIGDAVMSLFPNSISSALKGVIGMIHALERLNADHYVNKDPLKIGIGLHYGKLQLGTVGYANRLDATCIGDTVNTASRLEGLTKGFGASIIVSEEYYQRLMKEKSDLGTVKFCRLGDFILKGRTVPSALYEAYDTTWKETGSPRAELPEIHRLFAEQHFEECEQLCRRLAKSYTENYNILNFYAETCALYKEYEIPSSWNGAIPLTKDGTAKPLDYPKKQVAVPSTTSRAPSTVTVERSESVNSVLIGSPSRPGTPSRGARIRWCDKTKKYVVVDIDAQADMELKEQ